MKKRSWLWRSLAVVFAFALIAAACGDDDTTAVGDGGTGDGASGELTPVSLQLQWFTQAQFAGYYAALELGYFEDVGLDVTIIEGGVDIVPATVIDGGGADFGVSWVPRALVPREGGANVTNIAQIFQRSPTLQVSLASSGIETVEDLAGKKVGNWGFGNEYELFAGLRSAGLEPLGDDVELVDQQFDMLALLNGDIDAAQAMIYNEYAQVLETINPETNELYKPEDLNIINWNDVGTAMLQDGLWADADRLEDDPAYREAAVALVEGSVRGWAYCRDNHDECVQIVLDAAPTLGESHQSWQLNEISGLIWPSPLGAGIMDQSLWDQTIDVITTSDVLSEPPTEGAFLTDIAQEAIDNLVADGVDVVGDGFEPITVELREGGE